jgi:hypothetical protein
MLKQRDVSDEAPYIRTETVRLRVGGVALKLTADCRGELHDICDGIAGNAECSCDCHAGCTCHHGTGCILHPLEEERHLQGF